MSRIYHPYWLWEDYKKGFYNNLSGVNKEEKINSVKRLFNNAELTKRYMEKVIAEWKYSCEHNLTNPSVNKIAYIGQAACCIYDEVPNIVTMEVWSTLKQEVRNRANQQAQKVLNKWLDNNKQVQLCLNLD